MLALSKTKSSTDAKSSPQALRIGLVLFPGFEALDAFGPMDCLNALSSKCHITLSILSHTLDPVSTKSPFARQSVGQSIMPTHTFADAPALDVLIVPGGPGTHCLGSEPIEAAISFITAAYPHLKYLIAIRKGCDLVAHSDLFNTKPVTKKGKNGKLGIQPANKENTKSVAKAEKTEEEKTNEKKRLENAKKLEKIVNGWKAQVDSHADWAAGARWMVHENIWTASRGNSTVGIDIVLAWLEQLYGEWVAGEIAAQMEYERRGDARVDYFEAFHTMQENGNNWEW